MYKCGKKKEEVEVVGCFGLCAREAAAGDSEIPHNWLD